MDFEGTTVEYKREWTEDIIPEIVSFLNTSGGVLYIGIDNDLTVYGVDDPDKEMTRLINKVKDNISPSASLLVQIEIMRDAETGRHYICCKTAKGSDIPYYVKSSGIMKGVYIRIGGSKVQADERTVRRLIRDYDPVAFEMLRSPKQELSFAYAADCFAKSGIEFGDVQKRTLGLFNGEGQYTNLALWLSDQCPHIIKAASFRGNDMTDFDDRTEITGSLLMQFDTAVQFVSVHNKEFMTIDKQTMQRVEIRKFTDVAVREAILNALLHRDYSLRHPTQLKLFSDRLELVSFGGILSELSPQDIGSGISACRNERLADVLYRLHLVEAFGTGIPKMHKAYEKYRADPEISVGDGIFKVVLPAIDLSGIDPSFFA